LPVAIRAPRRDASAPPRTAPEAPARELTEQELLSFHGGPKTGPGGRFDGQDVVGTYRGHRFVAQYICSDVCPDHTVTVYHFIDLRTDEACKAIGAEMVRVPYGTASGARSFCRPRRGMGKAD
jgi:hypothetical protein